MHERSRPAAGEFGKVAVLMGGDSAEREISLLSGDAVLQSLMRSGVDAAGVDASDEGGEENVLNRLQQGQFDRVFIMLHGRKGEDGKIQGALEISNMPYTGSGVLASALAMDKVRTKQIWQSLELNTPPYMVLDQASDWDKVMEVLGTAFVKPVKEGSSIGISRVETVEELVEAYGKASEFDDVVIAEKFIDGPEYTVSIIGDRVLPVVGMKAATTFYDYEAKYFSDDTQYFCPCDLSAEAESKLGRMARRAYKAVGCQGWGRVDVMADSEGVFWLLEVNTVPGMTSHSLVPMAAKQAGIDFDALVLEILESSRIDRERD